MTLRHLLDEAVSYHPESLAVQFRQQGAWAVRTYREFGGRVRAVAELAGRLGIAPRAQPVALMLDNRPEWLEIFAGLAGCGVLVVPLDPKLKPAEVAFILKDSEAIAIFTDARHRDQLNAILPELPQIGQLVWLDEAAPCASCAGRPGLAYEAGLAEVAGTSQAAGGWYDRHLAQPEDLATLIYTSGTTGKPKGAMLTHANFWHDATGALQAVPDFAHTDRFLIVLPLFHSFAFTTNFVIPLMLGACMQFVESLRSVADDLRTLQPTILMAVPLLVEKIYTRIEGKLRRNRLARAMLAVGLKAIVARKVRRSLGGNLRLMVTGGAPCPVDVILGFRRLGIPIIEGYGLTEASPIVSLSTPRDARPGTIGYKLPNIEVRIAEPNAQSVGELQVRGPIVMRGYYHNPEATAEAFDGDWLRTGDLASIDADGYITIRGRCKALIVNREGKNIYPEEVEQCLAHHPYVGDVVVIGYHDVGDVGEKVGAIVVPNLEAVAADRRGQTPPWSEVEALVRKILQTRCSDLADYKHPRRIEIRREPLERTSTQKVRRHLYEGAFDAPPAPSTSARSPTAHERTPIHEAAETHGAVRAGRGSV